MTVRDFRNVFLGVGLTFGLVALAAGVYNYFPPPGMTYTPTAGLTIGSPTGGTCGAGYINAQNMQVNGTNVVGASVPAANPTGTVGLTAVNGSATTYLRSDGAPALSQSISPTWTGLHTFSPSSGEAIVVHANANQWGELVGGSSTTGGSFGLLVEAGTNSTDVPLAVYSQSTTAHFLRVYGDGGSVIGDPTGGDMGAGTMNVSSGLYVNGTAAVTNLLSFANISGNFGVSHLCHVFTTAATANISGCTRNAVGSYTVNFTTAYSLEPVCTITSAVVNVQFTYTAAATTYATVSAYDFTGAAADGPFSIYCVG